MARAELAAQIDVAASRVEDSLLHDEQGTIYDREDFDQRTKNITANELRATKVTKSGFFADEVSTRYFCVLVEMEPQVAKIVFDQIVSEGRRNLSPQSETRLYREFTRKLSEQELRQIKEQQAR